MECVGRWEGWINVGGAIANVVTHIVGATGASPHSIFPFLFAGESYSLAGLVLRHDSSGLSEQLVFVLFFAFVGVAQHQL